MLKSGPAIRAFGKSRIHQSVAVLAPDLDHFASYNFFLHYVFLNNDLASEWLPAVGTVSSQVPDAG